MKNDLLSSSVKDNSNMVHEDRMDLIQDEKEVSEQKIISELKKTKMASSQKFNMPSQIPFT